MIHKHTKLNLSIVSSNLMMVVWTLNNKISWDVVLLVWVVQGWVLQLEILLVPGGVGELRIEQ